MRINKNISVIFKSIYDLEKNVLVTFYKNNEYISEFNLDENLFCNVVHKNVYVIMKKLHEDNYQISISTIFSNVVKINKLIQYEMIENIFESGHIINHKEFENTIKIIKKNRTRFVLYELGVEIQKLTSDHSNEVDSIMTSIENNIDLLKSKLTIEGKGMSSILLKLMAKVKDINANKINSFLKTKIKEIDKKINFTENNIILVAGAAKHGKTKFVTYLVRMLLENNPEISVQWHTYEDDEDELILQFMSPYCRLSSSEILEKKRKLTTEELDRVISAGQRIKKYDINVIDEPSSIESIYHKFTVFAKQNPMKIPLLVIDNALLILNDEINRDDIIMNTLSRLRQRTKGIIILIHHFNDEQMGKERLKNGFRPMIKDIKGRESYRRVPKIVLLINKPNKYPEILSSYAPYKDILERMFIVDVAANRLMGKDTNYTDTSNESDLIYFFASLDYNIFIPLSELY